MGSQPCYVCFGSGWIAFERQRPLDVDVDSAARRPEVVREDFPCPRCGTPCEMIESTISCKVEELDEAGYRMAIESAKRAAIAYAMGLDGAGSVEVADAGITARLPVVSREYAEEYAHRSSDRDREQRAEIDRLRREVERLRATLAEAIEGPAR